MISFLFEHVLKVFCLILSYFLRQALFVCIVCFVSRTCCNDCTNNLLTNNSTFAVSFDSTATSTATSSSVTHLSSSTTMNSTSIGENSTSSLVATTGIIEATICKRLTSTSVSKACTTHRITTAKEAWSSLERKKLLVWFLKSTENMHSILVFLIHTQSCFVSIKYTD